MNYTELFSEFHRQWSAVNAAYEVYAKRIGMSYSALQILGEIYNAGAPVTQKNICERTYLPKTTVNTIVSGFIRQEYISLTESETDKREKIIALTRKGKKYARPIMEHMSESELSAFKMLGDGTIAALISGMEQYQRHFEEKLNHINKGQ